MIVVTILFKSGASLKVRAAKAGCDTQLGRLTSLNITGMSSNAGALLHYDLEQIVAVTWRDARWWERWLR